MATVTEELRHYLDLTSAATWGSGSGGGCCRALQSGCCVFRAALKDKPGGLTMPAAKLCIW